MTTPLKSILDHWQQQDWLSVIAVEQFGCFELGLALFSGATDVEYAGDDVTTETVTGETHISRSKSVVEGAAPRARVVGDYEYLVVLDPDLLIVLSDYARTLDLIPVIWAGHVPGGREIRFSVQA